MLPVRLLSSCLTVLITVTIALVLVVPASATICVQDQTVGLFENEDDFDGYILFAPIVYDTTYLIDSYGRLIQKWGSDYRPGLAVHLLQNGNLLRTAKTGSAAGSGGRIEEIAWDGTVVWYYDHCGGNYCQHHDIKPLPNGNILMISKQTMSSATAIAAGRNPELLGSGLRPEHIIEIKPTYPSGGTIVWEWHVEDHLIQDFDPTKLNYGVVEDHPELLDFNFADDNNANWLHVNSVDYNPVLDQIVISVRNRSEIWVIDHSTTTEEAAGHTGGNCGMGGDILYRWGNPQSYKASTEEDRQLFVQHDARWIKPGLPGEGNITIYNNGTGRPDGDYSTVLEITPPVDINGCYPQPGPGIAHEPATPAWTYVAPTPTDFYSSNISGAERLSNGNTLICEGANGRFFIVTPAGEIVWEYINPISGTGRLTQGDDPAGSNNVFKLEHYQRNYPGLADHDLTPGANLEIYPVSISGTELSPSVPLDSDSIWVTAEVLTSGTSLALVELNVNTGAVFTVTMLDDGSHHDGSAGDGVFGGLILPLPEATVVSYYVYAEDVMASCANEPANPPSTNHRFVVGPPCSDSKPVVLCSPDITTYNAAGECGVTVSFFTDATDDCPGVSVVANPASGSYFEIGTTSVEVIATDASGKGDTCYFDVIVEDVEGPIAVCPNDISVSRDPGQEGAEVNFVVDALDNCPIASVVATPPSGTLFPMGTTPVQVVAIDNSFNADTCYFSVSVGCCIPPSVGDLDQSGEVLPFNISGIDLSMMIDMLFISLEPVSCLEEADVDYSGQPDPQSVNVDGIDLSIMIDALFIGLNPLGACP